MGGATLVSAPEVTRRGVGDVRAVRASLGMVGGAPGTWRDNPQWQAQTPAGPLDITINLAKPEKDPAAIAAAASGRAEDAADDWCVLCWESAAMPGPGRGDGPDETPSVGAGDTADGARGAHLVRSGAPVTEVSLSGEPWAWWFSPYEYFPEHLIVASGEHRPMAIDHGTIPRLLDFVDVYPHWFIGSNADLPIVGGSILAHDHFQGGGYRFPLMKAPVERAFRIPEMPGVQAGIVRWPASVVRLRTTDRDALTEAACHVMDAWRAFSDEECGIVAFTEGRGTDGVDGAPVSPSPAASGASALTRHNTLNPILWREGDDYVLDLVLRNNRTTPERPFGLFHPDESLFYIKKENIGLIEIMGRAILPGRLAAELPAVRPECDRVFYQVLVATGVFKQDEQGRAGWDRFIAALQEAHCKP